MVRLAASLLCASCTALVRLRVEIARDVEAGAVARRVALLRRRRYAARAAGDLRGGAATSAEIRRLLALQAAIGLPGAQGRGADAVCIERRASARARGDRAEVARLTAELDALWARRTGSS